jgi:hypothetical protein
MPGPNARPTLVVTGKVVTPTGGYQVAFDRYMQVRKGYPPQSFVTLYVAPPPGGIGAGAAITHEVRWEWPLQQPVGSVIVRCGDKTLAEITRIQTCGLLQQGAGMFNVISLVIGFGALVLAVIAFLPLLGWANWFVIPLAIVGAGLGVLSKSTAGRNLNLFVILIGVVRLTIGGGIL